jgi:CheY-like chemotaxis protein
MGSQGHTMKVLVIDDNKEITEMLLFYLESLGDIECKVVNGGKEGLNMIKSDEFNLIILDLAMAEFSGLDVIESLKKDNLLEKKNIIILTASPIEKEDIERFIQDGIKAVLKKPISVDELSSVIQQFKH